MRIKLGSNCQRDWREGRFKSHPKFSNGFHNPGMFVSQNKLSKNGVLK